MKKFTFTALALLPIAVFAQKPFSLKGSVTNLKSGDKIFLSYRSDGKVVVDSTTVTDGKFQFKGMLSNPVKADLSLNKLVVPRSRGPVVDKLSFYIEPSQIKLAAVDSLKKGTITGSVTNDDDLKLAAISKPFNEEMNVINSLYGKLSAEEKKAQQETLGKKYNESFTKLKEAQLNFAKSNAKSFISMGILTQLAMEDQYVLEAEKLYAKMSSELKNSGAGLDLGKTIAATKNTAVGAYAMDFTQNDVNDKPVKLSDFKGKYVLLDFWASWCGPCRAENPNVVKAFHAYKDKNFTVLGVSLDQPGKKDLWLAAIEKDGLTWTHVSDLKYWNNEVAKMYGIYGIPANFLIDPSGKIIAKNIRGEELQTKLAALFASKTE